MTSYELGIRNYIKMGRSLRLSTQSELISKVAAMADSGWGSKSALLVA